MKSKRGQGILKNNMDFLLLSLTVHISYSIKSDVGQAVTVIRKHYSSMIINFFCPEFDDLDTNDRHVVSTG